MLSNDRNPIEEDTEMQEFNEKPVANNDDDDEDDLYLNDVFGLLQNVFAGYGSFAFIQTWRDLFRCISRIEIGCCFQ